VKNSQLDIEDIVSVACATMKMAVWNSILIILSSQKVIGITYPTTRCEWMTALCDILRLTRNHHRSNMLDFGDNACSGVYFGSCDYNQWRFSYLKFIYSLHSNMLSKKDLYDVIKKTPIASVDILFLNRGRVLLGSR
jgi:hypothetical protein